MTNIFTFKTPNNALITLTKLSFQEKKHLLSDIPDRHIIRILDSIQHPAYILPNQKVLHEVTFNKHAHLFDTIEDYKSFIKGEYFYDSVVLYDDTTGYASFGIRPSKINLLLKEKNYINQTYVDKEGYKTYSFENGSICFIKNTLKKTKRAFWFENKNAFDYYFYHVFDNQIQLE